MVAAWVAARPLLLRPDRLAHGFGDPLSGVVGTRPCFSASRPGNCAESAQFRADAGAESSSRRPGYAGRMSQYRPQVTDLAFALEHVVGYPEIAGMPGFEHADLDTVVELLEQCGEFMAEVVAPTNRAGDLEGARRLPDGSVVTPIRIQGGVRTSTSRRAGARCRCPKSSAAAASRDDRHRDAGAHDHGEHGLRARPLLTQGAIEALLHYGERRAEAALPAEDGDRRVERHHEPHRTAGGLGCRCAHARGGQHDDGSYAITGQKIFITFGDHDMAEQIVHLVLARTPEAPAGTKGISCFIVPKFLVNDDGSLGERNGVQTCRSSTSSASTVHPPACCRTRDATGYLIGDENFGMRIMYLREGTAGGHLLRRLEPGAVARTEASAPLLRPSARSQHCFPV